MVDRVHNYGGPSKISVMGIREIKSALNTSQYFGKLGDVKVLGNGREVVFAKLSTAAASAAVAVGTLMCAPAGVANHSRRAVTVTASIGETEIYLTIGATAIPKDEYADGLFVVECGTGTGYSYMIQGNPSAAASSTAAKVILKDGVEIALNTASLCTLYKNAYKDVATKADCAALTTKPVGLTLTSAALTNGGYCYLAKKGLWPARVEGTWVGGQKVAAGSAAGTVGPSLDTPTVTNIGYARASASTSGYGLVDLHL